MPPKRESTDYLVWLVIGLAAAIPLYLVRFTIGPVPTTVWEVGLWLVGLLAIVQGRLRFKTYLTDPFRWPLSFIFLASLIAVVVSPDHRLALGQWKAIFLDGYLWYGLLRSAIWERSIFARVMVGAWLGGSFVALEAIAEKLFHRTAIDGRVIGVYQADAHASPNYLALFLAPLASYAIVDTLESWRTGNRRRAFWTILAGVLMTAAVVLSGSRGGVLAIAGGVLLGSVLIALRVWPTRKMVISSLTALILLVGTWFVLPTILPSLTATESQGGRLISSNNIRWEIWRTTIKTIIPQTSPLGLGFGNYQTVFGRVTARRINFPEYITPYALHPHNFFLASYLLLGLLGLIGWIWLIIVGIQHLRLDTFAKTGLIAATSTWLLHGLVDTPFYKNDLAALWFVLLAGTVVAQTHSHATSKRFVMHNSWLTQLRTWWSHDRGFLNWTAVIVLFGAIVRLVGIFDRLHIGDDQARDLLTVKRSLETLHPFVVGPNLSPGNLPVFLGPFYYYLITPAAILSHFQPTGPALFTALVSILGLIGLAIFLRREVNQRVGLIALLIMSCSALVVTFHRFSWNPNLLPETILVFFIGFEGWARGRKWGFPLALISLVVATQLHATAFLLIPAFITAWIVVRPPRPTNQGLFWGTGLSVLSYAPLVFHEFKHHWLVFQGYSTIAQTSDLPLRPSAQLLHAWLNLVHFFVNDLMTHRASLIIAYCTVPIVMLGCWQLRRRPFGILLTAILVWGVVGIWFYPHLLVLHYFFFLITPIVVAVAVGLDTIAGWNASGRLAAGVFLAIFLATNVPVLFHEWRYIGKTDYPVRHSSQIVYRDVQRATNWVLTDAGTASPELLFVKPTASHNQVAFDLAVELAGRTVLERDGVLIAAHSADVAVLEEEIIHDSSREPLTSHHNPLYIIVEPRQTPPPSSFAELPVMTSRQFGEVGVLKIRQ